MMSSLSLFCNRCGKRSERIFDELCPPPYLRCACGAKFALQVEQEEDRDFFPDDEGGMGAGNEGEFALFDLGRAL